MKNIKLYSETPIEVSSFEELLKLKNEYRQNQKITFNCSICNQKAVRNLKASLKWGKLLCTHCALGEGSRQALIKDPDYYKKRQAKTAETLKNKYGENITNISQVEDVKKKKEQSFLEHYGFKCFWNSEESKKRLKEKYGVENIFYSKEIQKINHEKLRKNGGCGNSRKSTKNKARKTLLERYGVDNPSKSEIIIKRIKRTWLKKYGYEHAPRGKYKYDNILFDSKPEIAFWIYCTDNKLNIKREPKCLEYIYKNKVYKYYPDFEVDNQLIEIKGNQFLKEDGSWKSFIDSSLDSFAEAKHQCALQNNVKILYSKDYKKYLDYIDQKYGKKFLDQFRIKKQNKDASKQGSKVEEIKENE